MQAAAAPYSNIGGLLVMMEEGLTHLCEIQTTPDRKLALWAERIRIGCMLGYAALHSQGDNDEHVKAGLKSLREIIDMFTKDMNTVQEHLDETTTALHEAQLKIKLMEVELRNKD